VWGREMRAGLIFVTAALLLGSGFRTWRRTHQERFQSIVEALERSEQEAPVPAESDSAATATPAPARIDPNRADSASLTRLPGIGPALAARIVAERERNGRFDSPEALRRVRGIGPKTLERIRPFLEVAPILPR